MERKYNNVRKYRIQNIECGPKLTCLGFFYEKEISLSAKKKNQMMCYKVITQIKLGLVNNLRIFIYINVNTKQLSMPCHYYQNVIKGDTKAYLTFVQNTRKYNLDNLFTVF